MDIYMLCGRHISLRAYVNNVKGMYASGPGAIADCSEFIWGIYADTVVSYLDMN